jgi:hypothetical protein
MEKLVKENLITEIFTEEDTDPVRTMGIGGFSFETLSKGAIIAAKVPRLSLKRSNDGYFTYPGKGYDLPVDFPLLVISVRDYIIKGTKEIKIYKYEKELDEVMKVRKQLKDNPSFMGNFGVSTRMIINNKKFNRMFKVIEKGF